MCFTGSVVIVGDMDIRLDRSTEASALKFSSLLADFGCVQWVAAPTHDAGKLLDVMISRSDDGQLDPEIIDVGLSDH